MKRENEGWMRVLVTTWHWCVPMWVWELATPSVFSVTAWQRMTKQGFGCTVWFLNEKALMNGREREREREDRSVNTVCVCPQRCVYICVRLTVHTHRCTKERACSHAQVQYIHRWVWANVCLIAVLFIKSQTGRDRHAGWVPFLAASVDSTGC